MSDEELAFLDAVEQPPPTNDDEWEQLMEVWYSLPAKDRGRLSQCVVVQNGKPIMRGEV